MRTTTEILDRISKADDFFGTERSDLIQALSFDDAKQFLKDDVSRDDWEVQDGKAQLIEYLPFAWDKANDCRGLSAMRSLCHLKAWIFLMGHDIDSEYFDEYEFYGKEQLVFASELVKFNWQTHDNGVWTNDEGSCHNSTARDDAVSRAIQKAGVLNG